MKNCQKIKGNISNYIGHSTVTHGCGQIQVTRIITKHRDNAMAIDHSILTLLQLAHHGKTKIQSYYFKDSQR